MTTHTQSNPTMHDANRENWDDVKARLQQRWGQMDHGDFESSGTWDELLGRIQSKTGEARATVEEYATQLLNEAKVKANDWQSYAQQIVADAKQRAAGIQSTAADSVRTRSTQAQDVVGEQIAAAEQAVRTRPVQSLAYAFGLGALIGVMLGSRRG